MHCVSTIEFDEESGEYITTIPQEILDTMGWTENTPLIWVLEDGQVSIRLDAQARTAGHWRRR